MLERIYVKNHILFEDIELLFSSGLVVFTGSSGSGKSIFFQSLLAIFGLKTSNMDNGEATIQDDKNSEKITIFAQKKVNNKNRYYIDNKNISKNDMLKNAKEIISFLHVQDFSDFSSNSLITLFDIFISSKDKSYNKKLSLLNDDYCKLSVLKKSLLEIQEAQKNSIEKKEFLEFEINKIKEINPTVDEYDRLMKIKKDLSKKEKLQESLEKIDGVFKYEDKIINFLDSIQADSSFVNSFMSELTEHIEINKDKMATLDEYDIENILNKIDELSKLKQRYGSIQEALDYKTKKQKELDSFENIDFEKLDLEKQISSLEKNVEKNAIQISNIRKKTKEDFQQEIIYFCKKLYLGDFNIIIDTKDIDAKGIDLISITINNIKYESLSSGEINRLRLSLIAIKNKYKKSTGILILDEIDANLSGVESQSVAKILYEISKSYQVFSISHQPHLTSYATQHFLVTKEAKKSKIKEIKKDERVKEIARMISGENISPSSIKLAKELCMNKEK